MNFFRCNILFLDLEKKEFHTENLGEEMFLTWLGGRGLAGYFLRPFIRFSWDAPGSPLIIMTGPLTGTAAPASGKSCIMSRSALTGAVGDCSAGGNMGFEMRRAGIDGMVITGKSKILCGIEINDNSIRFTDARSLSLMETKPLYERLCKKGAVTSIGPAAENGVLFANVIINGIFPAGRTGIGMTFASKNLKYITLKGSGKVVVANEKKLSKASDDILRLTGVYPALSGEFGISRYGTPAFYDLTANLRMIPTDNFRKTYFEPSTRINAAAWRKKYNPVSTGCGDCPIRCKQISSGGVPLPEHDALSHFSALIGNENMEVISHALNICYQTGMDAVSAASALACYAEITNTCLSGKQIIRLLENISGGTGIGKELGQGSFRYAESCGAPHLSMSVKKLDLPAYDPRGAYGMALAYAVSTRGGCYERSFPQSHEILRKPIATDRFTFNGKARIIKISEDIHAVAGSLTACHHFFPAASIEEYIHVLQAVTGMEISARELMKTGERICYNERIMNAMNGFSVQDDILPERFFSMYGTSGDGKEIKPISREKMDEAVQKYYKIRGLDEKGFPVREKAEELNLKLTAE